MEWSVRSAVPHHGKSGRHCLGIRRPQGGGMPSRGMIGSISAAGHGGGARLSAGAGALNFSSARTMS